MRKIVEVGQRDPTACNLQTYSVVWVRDARLKEKVLDACGVSEDIIKNMVIGDQPTVTQATSNARPPLSP